MTNTGTMVSISNLSRCDVNKVVAVLGRIGVEDVSVRHFNVGQVNTDDRVKILQAMESECRFLVIDDEPDPYQAPTPSGHWAAIDLIKEFDDDREPWTGHVVVIGSSSVPVSEREGIAPTIDAEVGIPALFLLRNSSTATIEAKLRELLGL